MDEEDDRDIAASQDGSSDNDRDEIMRDADDAEPEPEPEPEPESPSNDSLVSEGQARNQQNADLLTQGPSPGRISPDPLLSFRPTVRPEALGASTYDIIPTTAAPHSTSINAIAATADMRWVFSGGSDGFIRKFNWVDSMNGKLMLTVAQRHPFVDSVVKAGVLMSYWPNMEGSSLSPVYSLASQAEGLWLLSGLDSGAIRLQSVRHDEGKEIALLRKHASAVSVLRLTSDERSLLSGSWDKTVVDWDLNTGQARRAFSSSVGQVSGIQIRPESTVPVPQETGEPHLTNGLSSSNRLADSSSLGTFNGDDVGQGESGQGQNAASPADSLFGSDSLFGDHDGPGEHEAPSGGAFPVEEDDEFSQALPNGIQHPEAPGQGEPGPPAEGNDTETVQSSTDVGQAPGDSTQDSHRVPGEAPNGISEALANGLPHADELELMSMMGVKQEPTPDAGSGINCDTTFLAASIDGTIRIWDRRQPDPVAKIISRTAPPWCMSACWSPDGNYIYAGRRNGTVEEYSMHKGLRNPERIFKLPPGSGAVSELQAMPNGRHLICASYDILRLYDLRHEQPSKHSTVPFLIVPGHRTGVVSQLYMDPACRFLISTGGNRGWEGITTEALLGYEIHVQ